MTALSKEQFAAGTKRAKQDIKRLKEKRQVLISVNKKGILTFDLMERTDDGFIAIVSNGNEVFKSDCEKSVINFLVNDVYAYIP